MLLAILLACSGVTAGQQNSTSHSNDAMVEEESDLRYYMDIFLREMSQAARSIRALANYLERNPDALLRGKVSRTNEKEGK